VETKKVELPSGQKVEIKKPGILALKQVYGLIPTLGESGASPAKVDKSAELDASIKLVCACCVAPRFSDGDAAIKGVKSIDELTLEDFTALAAAVNGFADLEGSGKKLRPLSETPTA